MVDSRYVELAFVRVVGHIQLLEKARNTALNAVTESDRLDTRVSLHISRKNCHGIRVVQEPSVRADLFHIPREILEHVNGAHSAKDSADAERVGDSLAQTVLFRHFKVDDGARVVKSDLNSVDHEIRAAQSVPSVLDAKVFVNSRASLIYRSVHRGDEQIRFLKAFAVNVIKCYLHIVEGVAHHSVAKDVFGENGASRAHKCDLHNLTSFRVFLIYEYIIHLFCVNSIALSNQNMV